MLAKRLFCELTPDELAQLQQVCQQNQTQRQRSHEALQAINDRYPDTAWLDEAERVLDEADQRPGRG